MEESPLSPLSPLSFSASSQEEEEDWVSQSELSELSAFLSPAPSLEEPQLATSDQPSPWELPWKSCQLRPEVSQPLPHRGRSQAQAHESGRSQLRGVVMGGAGGA